MQRKIAVAGGTGRVGSHIVELLRERGYEAVPMSRSTGVDVITGAGLDAALDGAGTIIDAATGPSPDEAEATAFFTAAARNLQAAGERAGVERMVVVSIIGIDRFSGGYNAAKLAQERIALAGPIPVHIVRAAQFHEFVSQLVDWGRQGDVSHVWAMRTQLVAARAVAEVVVDAAIAADFAPGGDHGGRWAARGVAGGGGAAARRRARRGAADRGGDGPVDPGRRAVRERRGAARPGRDPHRARVRGLGPELRRRRPAPRERRGPRAATAGSRTGWAA